MGAAEVSVVKKAEVPGLPPFPEPGQPMRFSTFRDVFLEH